MLHLEKGQTWPWQCIKSTCTVSAALQDQVGRKVLMTKAGLEEAIDNIRGAVMIAFPQGLPDCDLVRQALEGTEELAGTSVSLSCCDSGCDLSWQYRILYWYERSH